MPGPGPLNLITDVAGLKVGNASDETARSGVTAVVCPGGWVAAADVRGGGPATREIDVLGLENLVGRVHAISLSGGSVFGLAAADGMTAVLSQQGEGLSLAPTAPPVPIVSAASLYDLANAGDKGWGLEPPYRRLGMAALAAAGESFGIGAVGAGRGAMAGTRPGGLGSASLDLGDGFVVGALVAVNPVGSVYENDGETLLAWPFELNAEFGGRRPGPLPATGEPYPDTARLIRPTPGGATTLCVVAVSADLTGAECKRIAMMAQDGLARAIRPAHTPFDGDIVFCVARGRSPGDDVERPRMVARLGAAAADVLARAIARGVYAAAQG
jgi:L-aminopeptidase/D-esterase-like protein